MQNGGGTRAAARQLVEALLGDEPPSALRARVDWDRLKLMQLMQATAGADVAAREELVTRGMAALAKLAGQSQPEIEERALAGLRSMVEIVIGRSWRFVDGYENPLLDALRAGPVTTTPPGLRKYLEALATLTRTASAVTIAALESEAGGKLMTLLFVDGRYCGFLPGTLPAAVG